jgi:hypothetical protein
VSDIMQCLRCGLLAPAQTVHTSAFENSSPLPLASSSQGTATFDECRDKIYELLCKWPDTPVAEIEFYPANHEIDFVRAKECEVSFENMIGSERFKNIVVAYDIDTTDMRQPDLVYIKNGINENFKESASLQKLVTFKKKDNAHSPLVGLLCMYTKGARGLVRLVTLKDDMAGKSWLKWKEVQPVLFKDFEHAVSYFVWQLKCWCRHDGTHTKTTEKAFFRNMGGIPGLVGKFDSLMPRLKQTVVDPYTQPWEYLPLDADKFPMNEETRKWISGTIQRVMIIRRPNSTHPRKEMWDDEMDNILEDESMLPEHQYFAITACINAETNMGVCVCMHIHVT